MRELFLFGVCVREFFFCFLFEVCVRKLFFFLEGVGGCESRLLFGLCVRGLFLLGACVSESVFWGRACVSWFCFGRVGFCFGRACASWFLFGACVRKLIFVWSVRA